MKKLLITTALISSFSTYASAQQVIGYISGAGVGKPVAVSSANPLPVNASVSASIASFTPTSGTSNATLSATNSSTSTAMPTGVTQVITNTGSKTAYVTFSSGAGTATTSGYPITANSTVAFTPTGSTNINYITGGTDTTTLLISGGSGSFQGAGGGSSSGGSNGFVSQGSTTSGQTGPLILCSAIGTAATVTTATTNAVRCDLHQSLAVLNVDTSGNAIDPNAALPAGTNIIGKVGIDQTTPGTTNGVQDAATGAMASAVPSKGIYIAANSSGNLTGIIQADSSVAINISTATTTQLVALSSGKKIYITSFDVISAGTGNITFEYGTGSNCGTGTTILTGAYPLTAQAGIAKGNGLGAILVIPASNALCVLTSAAIQMSGSVAYTQF